MESLLGSLQAMSHVLHSPIAIYADNVSGTLHRPIEANPNTPLLVCIHGGGCNSGYFNLKGNSLVSAALERGMSVLLVDRPGYGKSSADATIEEPIAQGVAAVHSLILATQKQYFMADPRMIAMIGHSIGGAIALTFAADATILPLAALCVSGIGDRPTSEVLNFFLHKSQIVEATLEPPSHWFFGPEGSYNWRGPAALRAAAEPWRSDEVREIIEIWPQRWPQIVSDITCPVHLRLAEHEHIWEASPKALRRIRSAFTQTKVDTGILPDGGHLYELHLRGKELIKLQLDFISAQASHQL